MTVLTVFYGLYEPAPLCVDVRVARGAAEIRVCLVHVLPRLRASASVWAVPIGTACALSNRRRHVLEDVELETGTGLSGRAYTAVYSVFASCSCTLYSSTMFFNTVM